MKKIILKFRKLHKDRRGDMGILTAAIILGLAIFGTMILDLCRIRVIEYGVNKSVDSGARASIVENRQTLYLSQKDVSAAAYEYSGTNGTWDKKSGTDALISCLSDNMGLGKEGDDYVYRNSNGTEQYRLSDLTISEGNNMPSSENQSDYTITIKYSLKIPVLISGMKNRISTSQQVMVSLGKKF